MKRNEQSKASGLFRKILSLLTVLLILPPTVLQAQNKNVVTGTVVSASTGEPLAGAVVYIPGTNYNALTSEEGKYYLSFLPRKEGTQICFQFLGMENVTVAWTGQQTLDISMKDSEQLDDVVVTGYVNLRKEGFTGNTTKITKEELVKVSPKNIISSIQVFDPSFRIMENINAGSNPNALPEFYMRGQTGMNMEISTNTADISRQNLTSNNNLPIFILDGFEVGVEKIYDMDPTRILSLTLLKDAAATALYGSRAANGVVVIESRAPEQGRIRVQYNLTTGVEVPDLTAYNLMNAKEKLDAEVAAGFFKMNPDPTSSDATWISDYSHYIEKLNNVNRGVDTYWLSKPLRTAFHHKHSLYFDGGNEDLRWGAEFKYDKTNGVMKGSDRNTYGAGLILDYRVGKLQFLNRFDFDAMNSGEIPNQSFSDYSHLQPYATFLDPETGRYSRKLPVFGVIGITGLNPLYELAYMNSYDKNSYNEISDKFSLNYFATKDLTAKIQFAISKRFSEGKVFIDPASSAFASTTDPRQMGSLTTSQSETLSWDLNALLLYNKNIGKNYLNFTGGVELIENNIETLYASYTGFPSGALSSVNNAMTITAKPIRSSNETRLASFLALANYSYDDIYLLDASVRFDGSSEFGKDKKVAPFWSAGAGLNIHNYAFMKDNPVISRLKLRATYGQIGRVNFPVYAAKSSYVTASATDWYLTGVGNTLRFLGNDALTWEKTDSFDAGVDLGFMKDRLVLRATYYNKTTRDMITTVTLPSSSGFSSYYDNMGSVENKGIELDIRYTFYRSKDWEATLFGNLAHNKNKILRISEALKNYNEQIDKLYADYNSKHKSAEFSIPHTKFVEGGSTTSIFGMKSLGINPANGREVFVRPNGDITYEWNAADQQIIGNTEPKIQGSFGLNARWKQFSLFTSFLYRAGGQQYNQTLVNYVEDINLLESNADRRVGQQRWINPGDITALKDIALSGYATRPTSRFVQNDNTLQFNSLSISYDFDPSLLRKIRVSMLRLTASMQDLAYWSTIHRERGLDYPYARSLNFSVNLTF